MTSVLNALKPGAADSKTARAAAKPDKRTGVLPTHGHLAVRPPTAAHLSDDDVERLGAELDAIRARLDADAEVRFVASGTAANARAVVGLGLDDETAARVRAHLSSFGSTAPADQGAEMARLGLV